MSRGKNNQYEDDLMRWGSCVTRQEVAGKRGLQRRDWRGDNGFVNLKQ